MVAVATPTCWASRFCVIPNSLIRILRLAAMMAQTSWLASVDMGMVGFVDMGIDDLPLSLR